MDRGETLVLFGPSGVGKTILLKICMGLVRPDAGQVSIADSTLGRLRPGELDALRRDMGMVFQNYALFDSMTVFENVAFPLLEHSRPSLQEVRERVLAMLQAVNLDPGVAALRPAELSGGMKKRVGIARALVHRPRVVLYDDPTGGLDPVTADVINELIVTLNRQHQVASLAVSNDMATATRIGARLGMLFEGRILEIGTPDEIRASTNPYVRQFVEGKEEGPIRYV